MIDLSDAARRKSSRSGIGDDCVEVTSILWHRSSRSHTGDNCVEIAPVHWRKSRWSGPRGNCVEVASVAWRKSRRSYNGGANCVEVADAGQGIAVRDSKDPDGGRLVFSRGQWRVFAERVKGGEFDLS
ncbi:DUF397 domain-containing protein [Thermomonospora sp. CIF 1]|uniref:DUF397 domain-containing protein n=1 Tax=Thermomonospora sp. CIF 1 TaxID=1916083 RepID=UPI000CB5C1D9|nr:DUF397 domain-containing protein [Thermomonospora sp. CIF 1]PKK12023.1 MAG: DUF397 domain-containing protein [Thermomonospora sp. CIF 1]